ncbi:hypothetical protein VE00_06233 [Pseudogymnoascus sp. WSF 3629]|nr:hypothetical protein VE00_06233 [Pseudogymnoascus sp. WSF 3629]
MKSQLDNSRAALTLFLNHHPEIKYVSPTDPEFASLKTTYNQSASAVPMAIVRPQTANNVVALIYFCVSSSFQFTIRSGGNNIYGLSCVQDALMIDLRDINYIELDQTKSSVTVGGGVIVSNLLRELSKDGLVTPTGALGFLGLVGWSTYGGYGPITSRYGLGVDNILAAKVVNAKGEVVVANKELLKGIRGAGGALGVIVELTVKVYPLVQVLAGMIIFDSQDIISTYKNFNAGYQALLEDGSVPLELGVYQFIMNTPHGRAFSLTLVWSSEDHDTGRAIIAKIAALGPVMMNTVEPKTIADHIDFIGTQVPQRAYGTCQTVSIRKLNEDATEILGRAFEKMPSSFGTSLGVHELRGPSAAPNPKSVFASREPHFMLELISLVAKEEEVNESIEWATSLKNELLQMDPSNLLSGTYISVTRPGDVPLSKIYGPGSNFETLLGLKRNCLSQAAVHGAVTATASTWVCKAASEAVLRATTISATTALS